MTADDGAGGLREIDDARRTLERLEPARDLRLLDRQSIGGERFVRVAAELRAGAGDPALELGVPRAGRLARRAWRGDGTLSLRFRPVFRQLGVTQVALRQTIKK